MTARSASASRGDASAGIAPARTSYDLVIFDCDGVLVDSERLAVATEVEILAELGWALTHDEVVERFVGRSAADMQAAVEQELGRAVDWPTCFAARYAEVFDACLEAVPGVAEALGQLIAANVAVCVASSSARDAIAAKLERTGLDGLLSHRVCFSVDDVDRGKPAPDVFLHAAAAMGAAPARCAVVEDSPAGVEAGLAASMSVFAFDGGLVPRSRLERDGVTVFTAMHELPTLLGVGG